MADILELCRKPQTKTRIMYNTNLSYKTLQSCLSELEALNLLEEHHSVTRFATTEKGLNFLAKWSELNLLLSEGKSTRTLKPPVILFSPFSPPARN